MSNRTSGALIARLLIVALTAIFIAIGCSDSTAPESKGGSGNGGP
jgi:hypothetical protein